MRMPALTLAKMCVCDEEICANGKAENCCVMKSWKEERSQTGRANNSASRVESTLTTRTPKVPAMTEGMNGRITRFTSGDMSESVPKCQNRIGAVTRVAARLATNDSRNPKRSGRKTNHSVMRGAT